MSQARSPPKKYRAAFRIANAFPRTACSAHDDSHTSIVLLTATHSSIIVITSAVGKFVYRYNLILLNYNFTSQFSNSPSLTSSFARPTTLHFNGSAWGMGMDMDMFVIKICKPEHHSKGVYFSLVIRKTIRI